MKLCEDCKYFQPNIIKWNTIDLQNLCAICTRTSRVIKLSGKECDDERHSWLGCGKRARYFEQKD